MVVDGPVGDWQSHNWNKDILRMCTIFCMSPKDVGSSPAGSNLNITGGV